MAKKRKTKAKTSRTSSPVRTTTSAKAVVTTPQTTTMMSARQLTMTFIAWFIAHSVIFYLGNRFFPNHIVLGTNVFSMFQALMYSMLVFTLIAVGAAPVVEYVAMAMGRTLKALDWLVIYFIVNAAGIWVVARFAEQLGMGISSWVVAVVLAFIVDIIQGLIVTKAI